jgi:hypothetical protein
MKIHEHKPRTTNLQAMIKLHKPHTLIRPLISWKNAAAYKPVKNVSQTLSKYVHLSYVYSMHRLTIRLGLARTVLVF